MPVQLKVGQSLASTTDATVVVVVRVPAGDIRLTCGGADMLELKQASGSPRTKPAAGHDAGTLLGKRYETSDGSLELLCTKPGAGSLAANGQLLNVKVAKALPASD
jgi:hypothetical protein